MRVNKTGRVEMDRRRLIWDSNTADKLREAGVTAQLIEELVNFQPHPDATISHSFFQPFERPIPITKSIIGPDGWGRGNHRCREFLTERLTLAFGDDGMGKGTPASGGRRALS